MTEPHSPIADAFKPFEVIDKFDDLALRNGMIAVFFFDKPPEAITSEIAVALDTYLSIIPSGVLKYAVTSASAGQFKPFGPGTIAACRKQLAPAGSAKRDLTAVLLNSDGSKASQYAFHFVGQRPDVDMPDAVSMLSMLFPISVIGGGHEEEFCSTLGAISESLDYFYGYSSPALIPMLQALGSMTAKELRGLALRHPGYDLPSNPETSYLLGRRVRGARWITWLGPELTTALGGTSSLEEQLPKPIKLEQLSRGVMIRAGTLPELGDTNRRIDTPLLRKVAAALEPITLFGDQFSTIYRLFGDEELLRRWERRFLDSPGAP